MKGPNKSGSMLRAVDCTLLRAVNLCRWFYVLYPVHKTTDCVFLMHPRCITIGCIVSWGNRALVCGPSPTCHHVEHIRWTTQANVVGVFAWWCWLKYSSCLFISRISVGQLLAIDVAWSQKKLRSRDYYEVMTIEEYSWARGTQPSVM